MSVWVLSISASLFAVICSHPHFTDEEPESQRDVWGLLVHELQKCGAELQLGMLWLPSKPTLPKTRGHKWVFALCIYISAATSQSPGSESGLVPTCYNPHKWWAFLKKLVSMPSLLELWRMLTINTGLYPHPRSWLRILQVLFPFWAHRWILFPRPLHGATRLVLADWMWVEVMQWPVGCGSHPTSFPYLWNGHRGLSKGL